jgi:hypothetical protein
MSSHGRLAGDESISDINKKQKKNASKFKGGTARNSNIPLSPKLVRRHTALPLQYLERFYWSGPFFQFL